MVNTALTQQQDSSGDTPSEGSFSQITKEEVVNAATAFFAPMIGATIVLNKLTARNRVIAEDRKND